MQSVVYKAQPKRKLTRVTFDEKTENDVAEWLRQNPFLYDRKGVVGQPHWCSFM